MDKFKICLLVLLVSHCAGEGGGGCVCYQVNLFGLFWWTKFASIKFIAKYSVLMYHRLIKIFVIHSGVI